jgi:hypothetical protein
MRVIGLVAEADMRFRSGFDGRRALSRSADRFSSVSWPEYLTAYAIHSTPESSGDLTKTVLKGVNMSSQVTSVRSALACAIGGLTIINATTLVAQPDWLPEKPPEQVHPDAASQALTPLFPPTPAGDAKKSAAFPQPTEPFEVVGQGFRRVHRTQTITLTPEEVAERVAAGKGDQLRGNTITVNTFSDYLPENWLDVADVPAGANVDSFGRPIVNQAYALPGWAQEDVEALRSEIADWLLHLDNLDLALSGHVQQIVQVPPRAPMEVYLRDAENLQIDRNESQFILGNYLAQTFTRHIDVSDILPLDHARMTPQVVQSMARYFHFYEGLKAEHARGTGEEWPRGEYPAELAALLEANGHPMAQVLALPEQGEGGIAGAGDCYVNFTFGAGWTATVDGIGIWHGVNAPADDLSVDIAIGHRCYYQPCEDGNENLNVRVASNGYIGFFEQGAGQTPGTVFNNTSLPSATDPDGIAAPWWDDLLVANQGTVDEVVYKVEGAVGNRVLTVEYWSVSHFSGGTDEFYYFQAKLFEASLQVQFHYDIFSADPTVDSRTVGVENYSGTGATCGGSCSNTITGPSPNNYSFEYPQSGNDNCASAVCLVEGSVDGDNFGASGTDITPACAINDFADVWYRYRSPVSGNVTVSTCGNPWFDTTLAVFATCGGTLIDCDDDSCGLQSSITFPAVAGTTYLIRVAGYSGQRGLFTLTLDAVGAPTPGDLCESPLPISIPGTGAGNFSTSNATGCDSLCIGSVDEWLSFVPATSGVMRASTCIGDTNFDTTLVVFSGTCAALNQIACNDDAQVCNGQLTSRVNWVADAGVTYRIRVAGFGGANGNYDLALNLSNCPADIVPIPLGDGAVNADDLVSVILNWGPCNGCRQDFVPAGGNNQVDADDLVAVILGWGACPP